VFVYWSTLYLLYAIYFSNSRSLYTITEANELYIFRLEYPNYFIVSPQHVLADLDHCEGV